jgi:hypothetical protein
MHATRGAGPGREFDEFGSVSVCSVFGLLSLSVSFGSVEFGLFVIVSIMS